MLVYSKWFSIFSRIDIDLGEFVIVNISVCIGEMYIFMLCLWVSFIEL